jgi:lysozyme family protein
MNATSQEISTHKARIINEILRVEGGYVNDPSDSGGETNFGITVEVARANGYLGAIRDMPRKVAFDIYSAKYWDSVAGDELLALSPEIAEEVVDISVNMGPGRAGKFLQRALNVLNKSTELYDDLVVDWSVGPATIKALHKYLSVRECEVLVKALNCLQGAFYIELAERRAKDEKFIYGWLKNRVKL